MRTFFKLKLFIKFFIVLLFFLCGSYVNADVSTWENVDRIAGYGNVGISIAVNPATNEPWIAYPDMDGNLAGDLTVKKFDGTNWNLVGSAGFTGGNTPAAIIKFDNNNVPYVLYRLNEIITPLILKKFDGSNWVNVGYSTTGIYANISRNFSFTFDPQTNEPFVSYNDYVDRKIYVKKLPNGQNSWENVGVGALSTKESTGSAISFNPITKRPVVAYSDLQNFFAMSVKEFNGSDWVSIGNNTLGFGYAGDEISIVFDNNGKPYVAFNGTGSGSSSPRTTDIYTLDGGNYWTLIKHTLGTRSKIGINKLTNELIAGFMSDSDGYSPRLHVEKYNGSLWSNVGDPGFAITLSDLTIDSTNGIPYIAYNDYGPVIMRFSQKTEVERPVIGLLSGIYQSHQNVPLLTTTPNATIFYSITSPVPGFDNLGYSSPVYLSDYGIHQGGEFDYTIVAVAIKSGMSNSKFANATYKIKPDAPKILTPFTTPINKSYSSAQQVILSSNTPEAIIHYTTDGTDPIDSSQIYSTPLNITTSTTIKAVATKSDMANSDMMVANFVIDSNFKKYFLNDFINMITNFSQFNKLEKDGNINGDNVVDSRDLGIMMSRWN